MPAHVLTWDGIAGSGKTTAIIAREAEFDCALTYAKSARETLIRRGWKRPALTIYQATFPHVKAYLNKVVKYSDERPYMTRKILSSEDAALVDFVADRSGDREPNAIDLMEAALHGWIGGPCQVDLDQAGQMTYPSLRFLVPMAKWLADGAPLAGPAYGRIACDEWQDWSALEVRAAMAISENIEGFGDAGQAIFGPLKGVREGDQPAGWLFANERRFLARSRRVGPEASAMAAGCLKGIVSLPDASWADHQTEVIPWPSQARPEVGLVLGHSRPYVGRAFRSWGLKDKWIRSHRDAQPNQELCLATIHDAKGMESDDVYLLPWSSDKTVCAALGKPTSMLILYTALTRARKRAFVHPSLYSVLKWRRSLLD